MQGWGLKEPMDKVTLADRLIETLPFGMDSLFNPWRDLCVDDLRDNGPAAKLARLAAHLACEPEFILCGEAPGHLGCRHSGIAFTSERLLMEGAIPRVPAPSQRLTTRPLPFSEPSATIVWKALYRLGIAERTILWNALQLHPHRPGNRMTNRTPTSAEIALGKPALRILVKVFPSAKVVAVGKKAEGILREMCIVPAGMIRHPANGGATKFLTGLHSLVG